MIKINIRVYLALCLGCLMLSGFSASAQTKQEIVDAWQQQIKSFQTLQLDYELPYLDSKNPSGANTLLTLKHRFALSGDKYYNYLKYPGAETSTAKASAYNGDYYQKLIDENGEVTVYTTKKKDNSQQPYLSVHPLTIQYEFVYMLNNPRSIEFLKKPETWQRLVKRITEIRPFTRNGQQGFIVDVEIPRSKTIYQVFVDEKTLWPHHWSFGNRSQDEAQVNQLAEMDVEMVTSVGEKDATVMFPSQIALRALRDGKLVDEVHINTNLETLKINELIPDNIFTLAPQGATIINIEEQEKQYQRRKRYNESYPTGLALPTVKVGDNAPIFSLADSSGKKWDLANLRGQQNVLLTFYPKCFTGECPNHLSSLRDVYPQLQASNIRVLAVSVDPANGKMGQKEFIRRWKLPFPMIPDTERKLSMLYGAVQNKEQRAARMTFVIDKSGVVRFVDTNVNIETHGTDMLAQLRKLGMVEQIPSIILPRAEADPQNKIATPQNKIKVGQTAPNFNVIDANGKAWKLSHLQSKKAVALTFFPKCFTGGCANHLSSLRDHQADFDKHDVQIIAVSTDPADGDKGQRAFATQWKLLFPLIPDTTRTLSKLYGAVQADDERAARMTVLIDKAGMVRFVDTKVNIQTHGADVLAKLRELKIIEKLAGWE